jgi:hypothetical protein
MKSLAIVLLGLWMNLGVPAWAAGAVPPPAGALPDSSPDPKSSQAIWSGESGGFAIRWTTADLEAKSVAPPESLVFSAASLAKQGLQVFLPEALELMQDVRGSDQKRGCSYERRFTLLSVVGPLVSFQDDYYSYCQGWAHPSVDIRFTTVDLAKPGEALYVSPPESGPFDLDLAKLGKVARLTDYFPEKEVLRALLNDAVIKEALANQSLPQPPQSLDELYQALKEQGIRIKGIPYLLPQDFITRFAFHHLQGEQVAVRLGLPSAGGAARGLHAQLGILLPIPRALKGPLSSAASGKEGFLMENQKKMAGEGVTLIPFSFDRKGKVK